MIVIVVSISVIPNEMNESKTNESIPFFRIKFRQIISEMVLPQRDERALFASASLELIINIFI